MKVPAQGHNKLEALGMIQSAHTHACALWEKVCRKVLLSWVCLMEQCLKVGCRDVGLLIRRMFQYKKGKSGY